MRVVQHLEPLNRNAPVVLQTGQPVKLTILHLQLGLAYRIQ